jgi:glycosyltransferase involved in cell wall biosynthesis
MRPIISVIIPTYNRGWIVKEAIDSVLSQNDVSFELIVVDDGSSDNTSEILALYGNRIRVIRQDNQGVSAARNTGIHAALGDYIALLDSDDLWLPGKLTVQINFFTENPEALICQTDEIWIRNGRRVNPKRKHKKPSGMIFEPSLSLCLVSPSAVMIKKSLLLEAGGFDERLEACEDYDLWLRIGCTHPVHLIDEALVVKRGGHPDQLSGMAGLDRFRIQSLVKILESGALTPRQMRSAITVLKEKSTIYANGCRKRERHDEADHHTNLALKYCQ